MALLAVQLNAALLLLCAGELWTWRGPDPCGQSMPRCPPSLRASGVLYRSSAFWVLAGECSARLGSHEGTRSSAHAPGPAAPGRGAWALRLA